MNAISNHNFNLKNLFLLPFFFVFMPTWCLQTGDKSTLSFFFITLIFAYIVYAIFRFKILIKIITSSLRKKPLFIFFIWCIFILLSNIYIFCEHSHLSFFNFFIKNVGICLFFNICMTLFFPIFIINNKKSSLFFIKFLFIGIIGVILLGLLNYVGIHFSIGIINDFFDIIVNKRSITISTNPSDYKRVFSVFAEPAWLASWLVINMPIVDALCKSKFKILKYKMLNIIFKKFLMPFYIIVLLLTQSPIWIILGLILWGILNLKNIKNLIYPAIVVFLLCFIIINYGIDNNKVTKRINATLTTAFKNYEQFAQIENNLASRICSYYNLLRMFKDHPFIGIGLNNALYHMPDYYITSELALSSENRLLLMQSYSTGILNYNSSIIYHLLAETGIIGTILFYYFIFCMLKYLKSSIKCMPKNIINDFSQGLYKSIFLLYFICTFYDTGFTGTYNFIILGMAYAICKVNSHKILIPKKEITKNNDYS